MSVCTCEEHLCAPCDQQLGQDLRAIAGGRGHLPLIDELDITITRQNVTPGTMVSHGVTVGHKDESPILFNDRASDAASELRKVSRRVRAEMTEVYPHLNCVTSHPTDVGRWLLLIPGLLRDHPRIVALASAIRLATYAAVQAIDSMAERVWVGWCEECQRPLYASVDDEGAVQDRLIRCCGEAMRPSDLRARLIADTKGVLVTPRQSLDLVHKFTGVPRTLGALRMKLKRAGVEPVREIGGVKYYDVSEIIALWS